jgi:hypothetical protein
MRSRGAADPSVHGIDRMVRNVETGHFERSLAPSPRRARW